MKTLFYTGKGGDAPDTPVTLPTQTPGAATDPRSYLADEALVDAVNSALLLGQPLLLTGEPGTGKTQLASSLAHELGFGPPLRFETKSSSKARELFYTFDALGRFQAAQAKEESKPIQFVTYSALGKAILLANTPETYAGLYEHDFEHPGRRRSVVLIDEVDKAPRDFPNDLLTELEEVYFRLFECGNQRIEADDALRPVVVITSNSEKHLPEAFLRRCVYYDIPFPGPERLTKILEARLGSLVSGASGFLADALGLFHALRAEEAGLRKKPATAELLGWIRALKRMAPDEDNPLAADPERAWSTIGVLVKSREDREVARREVTRWAKER